MPETTHELDLETGNYRQIVSPERLREILDADGDSYERPDWLTDDDEWDTGEEES